LNRIDEIVNFNELTQADIAHIVEIQLHELGQRLASTRLSLIVTDAAKDWLTRAGYDPAYGARRSSASYSARSGTSWLSPSWRAIHRWDTVTVDIAGQGAEAPCDNEPGARGRGAEALPVRTALRGRPGAALTVLRGPCCAWTWPLCSCVPPLS